jgi:hypothetical protein
MISVADATIRGSRVTTELPLSGQDNPTAFSARISNGDTVPVRIRSLSRGFFDLFEIPVRTGLLDNVEGEMWCN